MAYYKVVVEGNNFLMPGKSGCRAIGFFTTFVIKASSPEDINKVLRRLMHERLKMHSVKSMNNFLNKSFLLIGSIYYATEQEYEKISEGFTFYDFGIIERIKLIYKIQFFNIFFRKKLLN